MIWSPSTIAAVGIDREAAVGVAVVRDADVGADAEHVLGERGRGASNRRRR